MSNATPEVGVRKESLADKLRRNPALLVVAGLLCGVGAVLLLTTPLLRVDPSEAQLLELPMPEGAAAKLPQDKPQRQSLIASVAPNLVPSWLRSGTPGRTSIAEVVVSRARKALGLPAAPRARPAAGADALPASAGKKLRLASAPATNASTSASYSASAQRPSMGGIATAFPEGATRLAGPAARGSDSSQMVLTGARMPSSGASPHKPVAPAPPVSSASGAARDSSSTALPERRGGDTTGLAAVPDAVADGRGSQASGETGTGAHNVIKDLKEITHAGDGTDRGRFISSLFNNLPDLAKKQWQAKFDALCTNASGAPVCDPVRVCLAARLYQECESACRLSKECTSFSAFPPTPSLSVQGCPTPQLTGARTIAVEGAAPGKVVTIHCKGPNAETCGYADAKTTSDTGDWSQYAKATVAGQYKSSLGVWEAWVVIDGKTSNHGICEVTPEP